jgi:Na+-translocating ferredoxin:NAD+ oxidoreductase RNF subunit RnfB
MTTAIIVIALLGLLCGVIIAVAARFFAVHEDPRLETLTALLPGINCGGCGYAGCGEYAKVLLADGVPITLCKPGGHEMVEKIAQFMGVEAVRTERKVAIVLCNGDDTRAVRKALYNGVTNCLAAELAGGAGKGCRYGCMGFGDCARVCPVDAIEITAGNLAVVHPGICIGCGKCVAACPRRLIKLAPESRFIHVLCSSHDRGPVTKKLCSVGCIGCGLCVKVTEGQGLRMENNLAVMDYATPVTNEDTIQRCPAKTIIKRIGTRPEAAKAG